MTELNKFDWDKAVSAIRKQYCVDGLSDAQIAVNLLRGGFPTRACQEMILRDVKSRWPGIDQDMPDDQILMNFNLGAFPPQPPYEEQEEAAAQRNQSEMFAERAQWWATLTEEERNEWLEAFATR